MKSKKNIKIAIVGHGFVGKATDSGFNKNVEKFIVDPKYNNSIKDLESFDPSIVFICVPTPMSDKGSQDSRIIESVIKALSVTCPQSIKVVKSTVLPHILEKLSKFEKRIVYNPEFLREKHADTDFENSKMIIFGGDKKHSLKVSEAYLNHSKCKTKDHVFTELKTASLIKYTINTFLASKVIFFNEMHAIYNQLSVNDSWEEIIEIISKDIRIGSSHMNVPGHDGRLGFGGACFPKDSLALAKYAKNNGISLDALKTIIRKNNKIRSKYAELDDRESEQNVSFDDKI